MCTGWLSNTWDGAIGFVNGSRGLIKISRRVTAKPRRLTGAPFSEIARGSALECGAAQDVLEVCGGLSAKENAEAKQALDRIVAILTKLGRRGYAVCEDATGYEIRECDADTDD